MTTVDQLCTRARVAASVVHELAGWDEVTELALRLAGDGHVALAPSVLKAQGALRRPGCLGLPDPEETGSAGRQETPVC